MKQALERWQRDKDFKENARPKHSNFFLAPHAPFDNEQVRKSLSHAERDFLMVLCHLSNRHADKEGWFWHTDRSFQTRDGKERGFEAYNFSDATCKRSRKKLVALHLIETKPGISKHGRWAGTMYRINPQLLRTGGHSDRRPPVNMTPRPRPP